jgi:hypothetical protein
MYQDGKHLVAVEYRPEEDRYSFYIGKGVSDLRDRATEDLMRRGLVKNLQTVQVDGWSA